MIRKKNKGVKEKMDENQSKGDINGRDKSGIASTSDSNKTNGFDSKLFESLMEKRYGKK